MYKKIKAQWGKQDTATNIEADRGLNTEHKVCPQRSYLPSEAIQPVTSSAVGEGLAGFRKVLRPWRNVAEFRRRTMLSVSPVCRSEAGRLGTASSRYAMNQRWLTITCKSRNPTQMNAAGCHYLAFHFRLSSCNRTSESSEPSALPIVSSTCPMS